MISEEDIKNIKEDLEVIRDTQTKGVYNSYRIDQTIEYIEQLEDKIECAKRELQEETGLISKDMMYLGQTGLAVAYTSEIIYIYYTNSFEQGKTNYDEDEILTTFKIPFDKALEMCNNGEIIDSKTIIGINLYNNLIRKNKKNNK